MHHWFDVITEGVIFFYPPGVASRLIHHASGSSENSDVIIVDDCTALNTITLLRSTLHKKIQINNDSASMLCASEQGACKVP